MKMSSPSVSVDGALWTRLRYSRCRYTSEAPTRRDCGDLPATLRADATGEKPTLAYFFPLRSQPYARRATPTARDATPCV
jgi:hypothetical protein